MWSRVFILVSFSGHIALFPLLYQPTGMCMHVHTCVMCIFMCTCVCTCVCVYVYVCVCACALCFYRAACCSCSFARASDQGDTVCRVFYADCHRTTTVPQVRLGVDAQCQHRHHWLPPHLIDMYIGPRSYPYIRGITLK